MNMVNSREKKLSNDFQICQKKYPKSLQYLNVKVNNWDTSGIRESPSVRVQIYDLPVHSVTSYVKLK